MKELMLPNFYIYKCELIRVIDGDTIIGMADLGFNTWKKVTIRLLYIDTPEIRTKNLSEKARGLRAKERVEELLQSNRFILFSKELDSFGRSLGIVYTEDMQDISNTLLNEGLAKPYNK